MTGSFAFAFGLTVLAGLATGIGSALVFFARRPNARLLALSLGFSAGVMIWVSFVELFSSAQALLVEVHGVAYGETLAAVAFFGGVAVIAAIDRFVPGPENPHEPSRVADMDAPRPQGDPAQLGRVGLLTALAIGIHNFPEGVATLFSALNDPVAGVATAVAIALHNIPEGISIAVPIYTATGSRQQAFWYSLFSGIAEPIGALAGYLLLRAFLTPAVVALVSAAVAGVMVFVSLDLLIPNAKAYDRGHDSVYGLVGGMAIMALTLVML